MDARKVRQIILEQSHRAHTGHIGSALSIVELVTALYGRVLSIPHPEDPERDRFVLSKGHAALALYAALFLRGWISAAELDSFHTDGSRLGVHPEHTLPGVDFSTGSLGLGMAMGSGAAMAARMQGSKRRAFVLVSDAECNEGSLWESVMFAAHHKLANLVAIIDLNGQQALGYTREVLDLRPMHERWAAFGWDAHQVDGHDADAIGACIAGLDTESGPPHVLVAQTTFGKGVSFMEGLIRWHYMPMTDDEFAIALAEIGGDG